jgi:hypothetical protein
VLRHLLQFVFLLFNFPRFEIGNFFFKFAYGLKQLRLSVVGLECAGLSRENYAVQFYNFALDLAASRRPIIAFVISPAALIDETIPAIAPISNGISFSLSTQRA